jgi:ankyrin repeat protein
VHGADVNAKDSFGRTALDDAASCERPEFARLLITSGARENLWDAGFLGDSKVADELLQNPALLDQRWQKFNRSHRLRLPSYTKPEPVMTRL